MRDRLVSKLARPGSGGKLVLVFVLSPRSVVVVCAVLVALGGGVKLPLPPLPADVDVPLGPSGRGPMGDATVLGVCEPVADPNCGELVLAAVVVAVVVAVAVAVGVVVAVAGFWGLVDRGAEIGNPLTSFLPTLPPPPPLLLVMAIYPPGGPSDRFSFLLPPFLILEKKPPPPPPLLLLPFLVDVKLETDCID